jgi:hypothetical protein
MSTTTVTRAILSCKAFYATLYDEPVILGQFAPDPITVYTPTYEPVLLYAPEMDAHLTVLGEIALADTQALLDQWQGGYAHIACTRPN